MNAPADIIPVVLFAYARPAHLARALACLRADGVPLIHAFADGAKGGADAAAVAETRALLRGIDWCEVRLTERPANLGLGRNVLAGVTEVAARHEAFIVWEDDLICVPGTYAWMSAALRHYAADERVMSVSAWTHPRVTPPTAGDTPYFDGRAECWVWGTWARCWAGMNEQTAAEKMAAVQRAGNATDAYGSDLPLMAVAEQKQNIWAVRWLYHHLQHRGLCLRPPWSMVEHIGFDASATNAAAAQQWANPPLRAVPPVPSTWPAAIEHPAVRGLWREANPPGGTIRGWVGRGRRLLRRGFEVARRQARARVGGWRWFRGNFSSWAEARAASVGYDDAAILARVVAATREVVAGRALWERDGVLFQTAEVNAPLLAQLRRIAAEGGGRLNVVDFGGALGSAWWQHRPELSRLAAVRWRVVEQSHYVTAGQEFADGRLDFAGSISAALRDMEPAVIIFSSVLPYVNDPVALLREAAALGFPHVIIDRTPFIAEGRTRLVVQHTPPELGGGSYPCWLFDRATLVEPLADRYELAAEWPALDDLDPDMRHQGLHYRRRA